MDINKYQTIVNKHTPKENKIGNLLTAFITGGILGSLANLILESYKYFFHLSKKEASGHMLVTFIFMACLLTSLGVFDDLVKKWKMGLIIPITGFAHSMQSSILDYKKEGLVYGFGSNMFKLAGSVILYGVVSAYVFGLVRFLIFGG